MPSSDFPPRVPSGSSPAAFPDRSSRLQLDCGGISQVPCMKLRCVRGVSDRAGSCDDSRLAPSSVLPSVSIKTSASRNCPLHDSIPGPHLPLSTLHAGTCAPSRMTRGQTGSLHPIRMRLALTASMPVSLAHNGMDSCLRLMFEIAGPHADAACSHQSGTLMPSWQGEALPISSAPQAGMSLISVISGLVPKRTGGPHVPVPALT